MSMMSKSKTGGILSLKNKGRLLASIISIIMCISTIQIPAWAGDAKVPTVKVAVSDDQSVIIDRILYEALARTGHQMVLK